VKITRAQKYTLQNVVYDLSKATVADSGKVIMAHTELINEGTQQQSMTRQLDFTHEETKTMTTEQSLEQSLEISVTVGHTVGVPDTAQTNFEASMTSSVTKAFTMGVEKSTTTSMTDSIQAHADIPAKSAMDVLVTAQRLKLNVPYTADLVTAYKDGTTSSKKTTGIHANVGTYKFSVVYKHAKPIGYKGCYKNASPNDLPKYMSITPMTLSKCITACKNKGYAYAAGQWFTECWCGQTFGKYGKAPESDCNTPCRGNSADICGGNWRLSIYST